MEQKVRHNSKAKARNFNVGDKVFIRNFHHGEMWLPGMIKQRIGPVSFLSDGRNRCCHQDQIRKRSVEADILSDSDLFSEVDVSIPSPEIAVPAPEVPVSSDEMITVDLEESVAPDTSSLEPVTQGSPPETIVETPASSQSTDSVVKSYPTKGLLLGLNHLGI